MRSRALVSTGVSLGLTAVLASLLVSVASGGTNSGCGLSGAFRTYSERIFYDQGGSGGMGNPTRELILTGHRWEYGPSNGSFSTAPISATDWKRWGVSPYGPTRKVVLSGWNGGSASGPIEGTSAAANFFWVIYRVEPPAVSAPASVEMKFGHAVVPTSCGPAAPPSLARLSITPAVIKAGGSVHATARLFRPNEALEITETYTLGGKKYKTSLVGGNANAKGILTFVHPTTLLAPLGVHTICVGTSSSRACASFTVEVATTTGSGSSTGSGSGTYTAPTTGPGFVAPGSGTYTAPTTGPGFVPPSGG